MNRPTARALSVFVTIVALLALPGSASAQRGVIGVSAIVAPPSTVVPPLATALHELPGKVREAIVRGRSGAVEAPEVRRDVGRGGSSWIITVKGAPAVPAAAIAPDRPSRVHVVTYTIAAAA